MMQSLVPDIFGLNDSCYYTARYRAFVLLCSWIVMDLYKEEVI